MVEDANPIGIAAFVLIVGCNRGSEGPRTDSAEGDLYLLQLLGPPLEDEGPPPVGVLGRDGPYN